MSTYEAPFIIKSYLYNSTERPTGIQLYGGPLVGTIIVSISIGKNALPESDPEGVTSGQLPKYNELAYITASQSRFTELCQAIDGGGLCTLWVRYHIDAGKRMVDDIWVQLAMLREISDNTARTAAAAEQIHEVVSERFDQLLGEVVRTNDILRERLPQPGAVLQHAATSDLPPHDSTNGGKH